MGSDIPFRTDSSGSLVPASLDGYFLVSETELIDPNFHQTVVLIVNHNEEGAFGLVLNRPSEASLGDVVEELSESEAGAATLFVGGPVEQQYLFTLHSGLPDHAISSYSSRPTDGVIFEPVFRYVQEYLNTEWSGTGRETRPSFNFYLGYAGWAPGQLESEIEDNAWLVIPADASIVFNSDPTDGWSAALHRKGGLYSIIARTGFKPSLN